MIQYLSQQQVKCLQKEAQYVMYLGFAANGDLHWHFYWHRSNNATRLLMCLRIAFILDTPERYAAQRTWLLGRMIGIDHSYLSEDDPSTIIASVYNPNLLQFRNAFANFAQSYKYLHGLSEWVESIGVTERKLRKAYSYP